MARTRMWMDPAAPPQDTEGTAENRMILGGRYLEQRFKGTMMGQPFEGVSLTAYDNALGKYVGSWIDNFGTGILTSESTVVTADTIECALRMTDPATGKMTDARDVLRIVGPDEHVFEMWMKGPDGKEFKTMEITYTRKK